MKLVPESAVRARLAASAATPVLASAPQAQAKAQSFQAPQVSRPNVPDTFSQPSGKGLFGDIIKGAGDVLHDIGNLFKNDREKLKESTRPFRDTLGSANALKAELSKLDPKDPRYAEVKGKLDAAEAKLQKMTGYSSDTAPKPGTLWVDPQYMSGMLKNGTVSQSRFPVGTPVTKPPAAIDALLQRDGVARLFDANGNKISVNSPEEYRAMVAQARAEAGMPVQGGEPIGVQLDLSGGGGKGKRFASVLSEMYRQGVVPTSVTGNSVGAIAAGLLAAGADPVYIDEMLKDPKLEKFKDWDLIDGGGAFNGNYAFNYFDQKLRELTGITDRPVTFADLKMPLQLIGTVMSDSADAKDYSKAENRVFVFSQENTPNTPVALAIQASIAMPGIWDPVQMVDPVTGREMTVVDGGVVDAMPMGYGHKGLPEIGLSLLGLDSNNPNDSHNSAQRKPVQGGDVDTSNIIASSINALKMNKDAAANADDFRNRVAPEAGQFHMSVPVWNLKNPHQQSTLLGYGFDPVADPILDKQGRELTQQFLRDNMGKLSDPTASGTNVTSRLPQQVQFDVQVENEGHRYRATYGGGDTVHFQALDGSRNIDLKLGREKIDAMWLDNAAFKDLPYQLSYQLDQDRRPIWEKVWEDISPI